MSVRECVLSVFVKLLFITFLKCKNRLPIPLYPAPPPRRYTYKFDAQKGEATWTIKPVKDGEGGDEGNRTLNVQTSRGSSYFFYFVRPKDNMAYLTPLIILVVEVVLIIICCVVVYCLEKRRERKVEER